jgi:hypothetical protein
MRKLVAGRSVTTLFHRRALVTPWLTRPRRILNERCRFRVLATATLLPLALAACQTPATRTQTVEVRVPVAVQPIKPEQVPAVPSPLGPRPESTSAAADMLLADHCKWVAYGLLTDPLLRVSAGEPPKMLPKYPECGER